MEVLAGARDESHLEALRGLLARASVLPTEPAHYDEAAQVDHEQRLRQVPVAVAEIVLQVVALVLQGVEPFILDLPTRPRGAHQLDDVVGGGHQVGDPGIAIGNLAVLDDPELDEVDERRVGLAVQRQTGDPLVLAAFAAVDGMVAVQQYPTRYTDRVAIANSRITAANSDSVSFRYQDYGGGHRHRVMKLDSVEFLRRFLQHVLPDRFVRIRHYGFLANRARKQKLPLCRHLIAQASGHHMITAPDLSAFLQPAGDDHLRCPVCHAGTMRRIEDFRRQPTSEYLPLRRGPPDTA